MGVHVEASIIYSKGNENEVIQVAEAVSDISPTIPLQVMRFLPFGYASITLEPSIGEAEKLCASLRKYADCVYLFNSPGTELLHTYCPKCSSLLIEREFHEPMGSRLIKPWESYTCTCGNSVPVKRIDTNQSFSEIDFMDGHGISQAFRMVHAVLACLGILDDELMNAWGNNNLMDVVWRDVSDTKTLMQIQHMIQQPYSYLEFIELIAKKAKAQKKGKRSLLICVLALKLFILLQQKTEVIRHIIAWDLLSLL